MSRKLIKDNDNEFLIYWDNFTFSLYRGKVVDSIIRKLISSILSGKNLTQSESELWLVCPEDRYWFKYNAEDGNLIIESNRTSISFTLTLDDKLEFVSLLEEFLKIEIK